MKRILSALALTLGISSMAQAGMVIEPYLGYSSGDFKYTSISPASTVSAKTSGTDLGLRLGYKFLLPWVALDYTLSTGKAKADTDADYSGTGLGFTFGVNLPMLHPYAGYGFSNQYKVSDASGSSTFKGTYTKVGVGLGFIPFVDVLLEYKINSYSKVETSTGEYDQSLLFSDLSHGTMMIGVSLPL